MKLFMIMNIFMMIIPMNIFISLIMFKLMNLKFNLIKKMIYLMVFTMSMSIYSYFNTMISLNPMLIMITFISGLMIMFIYFTSTMNIPLKKNFIIIMIFMLLMMINFFIFFNNNYMKFNLFNFFFKNDIYLIYMNTKINLMIIMILMLIMILYISFKICYIKKKSLRSIF